MLTKLSGNRFAGGVRRDRGGDWFRRRRRRWSREWNFYLGFHCRFCTLGSRRRGGHNLSGAFQFSDGTLNLKNSVRKLSEMLLIFCAFALLADAGANQPNPRPENYEKYERGEKEQRTNFVHICGRVGGLYYPRPPSPILALGYQGLSACDGIALGAAISNAMPGSFNYSRPATSSHLAQKFENHFSRTPFTTSPACLPSGQSSAPVSSIQVLILVPPPAYWSNSTHCSMV
jgi:hypothetical protein